MAAVGTWTRYINKRAKRVRNTCLSKWSRKCWLRWPRHGEEGEGSWTSPPCPTAQVGSPQKRSYRISQINRVAHLLFHPVHIKSRVPCSSPSCMTIIIIFVLVGRCGWTERQQCRAQLALSRWQGRLLRRSSSISGSQSASSGTGDEGSRCQWPNCQRQVRWK